jgi:hypothetical protein
MTQSPSVVCKDCGRSFCGGNFRIVEHILNKCTCSTSELQALRTELLTEKEAKAGKAAAKAAVTAVNAAAESKPIVTGALPAPVPVGLGQMGLAQSFNRGRGIRVVCTLFTVPWEVECIHAFMHHTRMWLLTAYRCIRMHHLGIT